jgi:hypothetical protein
MWMKRPLNPLIPVDELKRVVTRLISVSKTEVDSGDPPKKTPPRQDAASNAKPAV